MYVPAHFSMSRDEVADVLGTMTIAHLVTLHDEGLVATPLPFLHEPAEDGLGSLVGHVARNNRQWSAPTRAESLAIVTPNDHYVSPRWRTAGDATGTVVPTWNYVTVHAYGDLVAHDDPGWTRDVVTRLSAEHEDGRERPWRPEDLTGGYLDRMLRAIVGVELRITRVEAKAKLSQNVSVPDIEGIVAGLRAGGDERSAGLLEAVSVPAVHRRADLLAEVAEHARRSGR